MVISMIFFLITSGPCETPVNPVQLICVAVGVAVEVGSGVLVGVSVAVGVLVSTGVNLPILIEVGMYVAVMVGVKVNVFVGLMIVGVRDGVLVSAANPVGSAFPTMGMDIKKERALADTTASGCIGRSLRIGSYLVET